MLEAVLLMGDWELLLVVPWPLHPRCFTSMWTHWSLQLTMPFPEPTVGDAAFRAGTPNAQAIAEGKSSPDSCVAAGPEVAEAIAALLGVSIEAREPEIALPGVSLQHRRYRH